ncbi:MAG TPA: hypothetical protein VEC14_14165 [Reyranellaceae bacterium]|nr:hypothetical protein [Reyranellaceae bacterium]
MKETLTSIKAKFSADKAKFSQAMTILGEKPEISFAALEAEMTQLELSALQVQVTNLTTKVTELSGQVTTLTTERDQARKDLAALQGKYDTLKASGHAGGDLATGAPSAGAADEPNPWAADSLSFTRQAEIALEDPKRAAQLQAAAKNAKKK